MSSEEVKAILASRRIAADDSQVESIIEIVRQNIGIE